ncbi:MAG: GNAT family N-acetyltransferase [Acidobacteria bacterium]|nr:GNAT family N-acetyltransferase [Acidobacteriota bacterium]
MTAVVDESRIGAAGFAGRQDLRVELGSPQSLREDWERLLPLARTRNVFVSWHFLCTWWEHFQREREPRCFVVREGARAVAIVPLYLEQLDSRVGTVCVLRNVGYGDVVNPDFLDALVESGREQEVARALAPYVLAEPWQLAEFSELEDDGSLTRMAAQWRAMGAVEVRSEPRSVCPYIPLPESLDAYLASRGSHFRQQLRRYRRVIERELGVEWRRVGVDVDAQTGIELLARLHQERMEASGRGGNFRKEDYANFHRDLAARLAEAGELYFWVLFIEGLPGASHYGFLHDGVYYGYQMGFTPHYERYSIGHYMTGVVLHKLIEEEGAREMNLLRGSDPWKFRWTSHARTTRALWMLRPGLRGRWAWLQRTLSQSPALVLRSLVGRDNFDELRGAMRLFSGRRPRGA